MPLVDDRPWATPEDALRIAREHFGFEGLARELPSERDRNYRLTCDGGQEVVLKIANPSESRPFLERQNAALDHVKTHFTGPADHQACPLVHRTLDDQEIVPVEFRDGDRHQTCLVRALSYLPGTPLAHYRPRNEPLLERLGQFLASLSAALESFDTVGLTEDFHWNLTQAEATFDKRISLLREGAPRAVIEHFATLHEEIVIPRAMSLPRQTVHGDANDYNVLVNAKRSDAAEAFGIIDFGDMGKSYRVSELAIGTAYAILGSPRPLDAAAALVRGYARTGRALTEPELEVLFPLVCTRLCMSVLIAAEQRRSAPDNEYLSITEDSAWNTLEKLEQVHPRLAHYTLRDAAGLEAHPDAPAVRAHLSKQIAQAAARPPVAMTEPACLVNLSTASPLTTEEMPGENGARFQKRIRDHLEDEGAAFGIGRYAEARLLYTSAHFQPGSTREGDEPRTIHLGIDLFARAGTEVLAPLPGTVKSLTINAAPLDYGPTIILEHRPTGAPPFYSLYGHLDPDSLQAPLMCVGREVRVGERIGTIGERDVNGGWPPHLHFQFFLDELDHRGDYPGVSRPRDLSLYRSLCPDPSEFFAADAKTPIATASAPHAELIERRKALLGPSLSLSYARPLHIVRGKGATLYDKNGLDYLDTVNNVCHVGHAHPHVVKAARQQMAVLNTNTRYLHENLVQYAERLVATFPTPLEVCYFVCTGSEANELALRLAQAHTGARDVMVLEGAYHGNTSTLIDISPYKHDRKGGKGTPSWVHKLAMPDPFRGRHRGRKTGAAYAALAKAKLAELTHHGTKAATFIAESILSCGGQVVLPDGYLREVYAAVRAQGGVCIADEVQVGFGRCGTHMWAFELQGVTPDIVTVGKPIGNGHPLAAVITTRAIAESFDNGMEYFNTFGGKPRLFARWENAVLDVLERERLMANAHTVGQRLQSGLKELAADFDLVADVRGHGLFLGIEFVRDHDTLEPADDEARYIVERLRDLRILASVDGPLNNVIKIKPPLVFRASEADRYVESLRRVLDETLLR